MVTNRSAMAPWKTTNTICPLDDKWVTDIVIECLSCHSLNKVLLREHPLKDSQLLDLALSAPVKRHITFLSHQQCSGGVPGRGVIVQYKHKCVCSSRLFVFCSNIVSLYPRPRWWREHLSLSQAAGKTPQHPGGRRGRLSTYTARLKLVLSGALKAWPPPIRLITADS